MSCDKRPHSRSLATHWDDNYPALLALLGSVHTGVRGLTMDTEGNILAGVRISVRSEWSGPGPMLTRCTLHRGLEREVRSNERGEFWLVVLPGEYRLRAEHTNQYGTLATELTVSLASYLGEGASTEHLHLTPR